MVMLDDAEAYSEQDFRDIIADYTEVGEFYQTMVETRQSYRKAHADSQPIDTDEAWRRFAGNHLSDEVHHSKRHRPSKYAAAIVGVLLVSAFSCAAIFQLSHRPESHQARQTAAATAKQATPAIAASEEKTDTLQLEPTTFDNVPLDDMLAEIACHYGMKVRFLSGGTKHLRLFFTWNPQASADNTISKLNQFECLSIKREGENIIVE